MSGPGFSQHPTDALIRELVRSGRRVTDEEVARIVERMATAPFDTQDRHVPVVERGASYLGQTLGARADSFTYHFIKRVAIERQWAVGTTPQQYVDDLRLAVRFPRARLAVYERRGGFVAAMVTPTGAILTAARRGDDALPILLVVFSADRGTLISGYQASGLDELAIPEEARWLR